MPVPWPCMPLISILKYHTGRIQEAFTFKTQLLEIDFDIVFFQDPYCAYQTSRTRKYGINFTRSRSFNKRLILLVTDQIIFYLLRKKFIFQMNNFLLQLDDKTLCFCSTVLSILESLRQVTDGLLITVLSL